MGTRLTEGQTTALREWIRRLRTTDRIQGKGTMHSEVVGVHRWCCLGVGAEIAAEQRAIESEQHAMPIQTDTTVAATLQTIVHSYDGSIAKMSQRTRRYFGIDAQTVNRLIYMNDNAGLPFAKIADFLEREFLSDHDTATGTTNRHPAESAGPRTTSASGQPDQRNQPVPVVPRERRPLDP